MKAGHLKIFLLALLSVLLIDASTEAFANDKYRGEPDKSDDLFFNQEPVTDDELDSMRGGFVTRNGMVIDFSFSSRTLVDGQLINQVGLSTADLAASADVLRGIIQIGEGNSVNSSAADLNHFPQVLTVIQNNLDNLTIQQLNLLDISVQNMNRFIARARMPEVDFQSTLHLAP